MTLVVTHVCLGIYIFHIICNGGFLNIVLILISKILNAVRETGAEAVHPGYGFLSENTVFVSELEKAGVTFIGPNSNAIKDMGDKIASKR